VNHLGELISTALQTAAHELPKEGLAGVVIILIIGLVIWFRGRKMAKLAFAGFGAAALGLIGFVLADWVGLGASAWIGGVVGLLAGAILGTMLLRFTAAIALALVLAFIAPMVTATAMVRFGTPDGVREKVKDAADSITTPFLEDVPIVDSFDDAPDLAIDALGKDNSDDLSDGVERARAFLARLGEELRPVWEQVPKDDRILLVASSVLGMALGFALGMVFPGKATTLITAGVGAALWLPAAVVAYSAQDVLPHREIPTWPGLWAGTWAVVTVIGVFLQSRAGRHSTDRNRDKKPETPA